MAATISLTQRFLIATLFFAEAPLAQLAEQLTLNQRVQGSSPWWRILDKPLVAQEVTSGFVFGRRPV